MERVWLLLLRTVRDLASNPFLRYCSRALLTSEVDEKTLVRIGERRRAVGAAHGKPVGMAAG